MKTGIFSNIWIRSLWLAINRFNSKNGWVMSSHIAMSMMLALFPFVLFTVALAGTVAGLLSQDVAMETMTEQVFSVWPDAVARPILTELKAVLQTSNTQLVTLGGLFALGRPGAAMPGEFGLGFAGTHALIHTMQGQLITAFQLARKAFCRNGHGLFGTIHL